MLKVSDSTWKQAQEVEASYWAKLVDEQDVPFFERTAEYFEEFKGHLADCPYDNVVEFGCGPVGLLPHVTANLKVGLDPLALEYAHQGFDYRKRDFCILNVKGEECPLIDGWADLVICINVLDHAHDPRQLLEEIYRVCRTGGKILISCDLRDRKSQIDKWHPILISTKDIESFFKDKGSHIVSRNLWPPHRIMEGVDPVSGTLNIVITRQ